MLAALNESKVLSSVALLRGVDYPHGSGSESKCGVIGTKRSAWSP